MLMKNLFSFLCLMCFVVNSFAQNPVIHDSRIQQAEEIFKSALIKNFIHPDQLDEESWTQCRTSINGLLEKFEEDFVAIRLEKAFKSSEATNYFTPIFIYADGREFNLPAFKIMQ